MKSNDRVWQEASVVDHYLGGVRGAIPLANEQIQIMLRLIGCARPKVDTFLDFGCGDGVLGRAILARFPTAQGAFLDFSKPMIASAKRRLGSATRGQQFIVQDYGQTGWTKSFTHTRLFDVVVSGFSIHHQPDRRKRKIYGEIFDLLKPGGIFLNLEHVASESHWGEKIFDQYFVDALFDFYRRSGGTRSRNELGRDYGKRPDKKANILASVEDQCAWLREAGFIRVDCFFKVFELALFGGMKPEKLPRKHSPVRK